MRYATNRSTTSWHWLLIPGLAICLAAMGCATAGRPEAASPPLSPAAAPFALSHATQAPRRIPADRPVAHGSEATGAVAAVQAVAPSRPAWASTAPATGSGSLVSAPGSLAMSEVETVPFTARELRRRRVRAAATWSGASSSFASCFT